MADVVIDLNDQRPIWRQPAWFAREIREALPPSWSLAVMDTPSDGTGDGSTAAHPAVLEAVADARVYMGFGVAEALLVGAPNLQWAHSGSAGVASSMSPEMLRRDILLTNTAGVHGPPMAEAALGMILHFFRGFDLAAPGQREGRWDPSPFYAADSPVREIAGATVGIVGLGGIGRELARRCRALGARVVGLRRSPGPSPVEGVECRTGREGLRSLLAESDAVVVTAPETSETRGLLDAGAFEAVKPGVVFVNVARGGVVEEEALISALRDGRLRGAGLDVFATEPLPKDSPLWSMPNVLITPHVSPVSRGFWRREADLILHNLRCFIEGRRGDMRNVVDKDAGY